MSGCRVHGDDIGPYVLGALEPGEMEAVRRHLTACARCAAEARALSGLPGLLDRAQADEEPATLSPRLEDEVLDRFVRDRGAAASEASRRGRPGLVARVRGARPALPALGAGAAVALVIAVVALWPGGGDDVAYARAEMRGHGAWAVASVAQVSSGTRVRVEADRLRRGMYELWCVRSDGRWVSGGSFRAHDDGSAAAEFTAAVRAGEYHTVVITRRSSDGERGAEVMRGELVY